MADELVELLRRLEEELHRPETRRDVDRMQMLLHPQFEEIGRSGRRYSREDTLRECVGGSDPDVAIKRDDELNERDQRHLLRVIVLIASSC